MGELIEIQRFLTREEAEIVRTSLEAADLHAVVLTDDAGGMRPFMSMGHGVRLMVAAEHMQEAQAIIEQTLPPEQKDPLFPKPWELERDCRKIWRNSLAMLIFPIFGQIYVLASAISLVNEWPHLNAGQKKNLVVSLILNFSVLSIILIPIVLFY